MRSQKKHATHPIVAFSVGALIAIELLFIALTLPSQGPQFDYLAAVYPKVLVAYVNDAREDAGMPALHTSEALTRAAQLKADDMAQKGYFAHESPGGEEPWDWISKTGYQYRAAGENLAVNFKDSKALHQAWMDSPGHRANIVRSNFTEIGIATSVGTYNGRRVTFVVQMFGTPLGAPKPAAPMPPKKSIHSVLPTAHYASAAALPAEGALALLLLASPTVFATTAIITVALMALLFSIGGAVFFAHPLRFAALRAGVVTAASGAFLLLNAYLFTQGGVVG